jgi:multisubunit Na+/H+ antiporter MnhB subunit
MNAELLKTLGQVLGIGGLALGIFFLLFREIIRKSIFPTLKKDDAYRLLRLISVLIWSVAVIGIGAWILGDRKAAANSVTTTGPQSPVVQETKGDVRIDFNTTQPAPK